MFSFGEVNFAGAERKEVVDAFTRVCLLCARNVALCGARVARALTWMFKNWRQGYYLRFLVTSYPRVRDIRHSEGGASDLAAL